MSEGMQYNDPVGGTPSTIGSQIRTDHYIKQALKEAQKEQHFSQLADVTHMPKNMGKTIKRFHYLPILDDANINDQGIDAMGAITTRSFTIIITKPVVASTGNGFVSMYAVGEGASDGAARTDAESKAEDIFKNENIFNTDYAVTKSALEALTPPWIVDDTGTAVPAGGNLYGSSKDVGRISSKLPALSETGGKVNRVGHKRIQIEGTLQKFGFHQRFTQESFDFDTDAELYKHLYREAIMAANEMTEDALQIDLLHSAGVLRYGGDALSDDEVTGEGGTPSLITYEDLMRMSIELDDNRCPKHTKLISGTRMIDTRVINSGRVLYIGSELEPLVRSMTDPFGNQAFIDSAHYAAAGNLLPNEIGTIHQFRIIVVPEMMHWAGKGAVVTANGGYRESGGRYNIYPMLVVGNEAFSTIGFQTDGKSWKFTITTKKPGKEVADLSNPYGEIGFTSIKWYYGFVLWRPERIALAKTVAAW